MDIPRQDDGVGGNERHVVELGANAVVGACAPCRFDRSQSRLPDIVRANPEEEANHRTPGDPETLISADIRSIPIFVVVEQTPKGRRRCGDPARVGIGGEKVHADPPQFAPGATGWHTREHRRSSHSRLEGSAGRPAPNKLVGADCQAIGGGPVEGSRSFPLLRQVVLDTTDARGLAEFYRQLLGFVYRVGDEPPGAGETDERGNDWLVVHHPSGSPRVAFQQVRALPESTWPEGKVPQQLHLDLTVATLQELDIQHKRVVQLGARPLSDRSHDEEEPLRVYADPAGHPFCIFVVG
jgi:hypothetical protein